MNLSGGTSESGTTSDSQVSEKDNTQASLYSYRYREFARNSSIFPFIDWTLESRIVGSGIFVLFLNLWPHLLSRIFSSSFLVILHPGCFVSPSLHVCPLWPILPNASCYIARDHFCYSAVCVAADILRSSNAVSGNSKSNPGRRISTVPTSCRSTVA